MKIQGLEKFRDYFADYTDHYTLIGGAACYLAMDDAGLDFRATKDLDIVLCAESINPAFVQRLWAFVQEAGYQRQEKGTGAKQFYRFSAPDNAQYPAMLELFSRVPDGVVLTGEPHLTPIPMGEDASSLSAILLDQEYYQCIQVGKMLIDGVAILGPEYILPLKARAWLDLSQRKADGEAIDSKNIKKHRNDVFRLYSILPLALRLTLAPQVAQDLANFFARMPDETGLTMADFGIRQASLALVLENLNKIYGLNYE